MSLLPPDFIDSVVAIGDLVRENNLWVGSGFLYGSLEPEPKGAWGTEGKKVTLWLVTNRHVSEVLQDPIIRFDSTTNGNAVQINLDKIARTPSWTSHPDPLIDVSVIQLLIDPLKAINAKLKFFEESTSAATLAELKSLGVHEGNGGFILGFPLGLVEGPTGSVIARKTSIARIRNAYENKSATILVDGSAFPGNSGGPAVIHPEPIVIQGTSPIEKAFLIGIVASYLPFQDVAISQSTKRPRVIFEENSGLCNIFTVDCIHETIQYAKKNLSLEKHTQTAN
jgi:hypothetical protein